MRPRERDFRNRSIGKVRCVRSSSSFFVLTRMGYRCRAGCGRWGVFDGLCHACARADPGVGNTLAFRQYEEARARALQGGTAALASEGLQCDPSDSVDEFISFDVTRHGVSSSYGL